MNNFKTKGPREGTELIQFKDVESKIIVVRDQKVILDCEVAELYGVKTSAINQAVRNNPQKFPEGYVFELNSEESDCLRSKILTLKKRGRGGFSKYNYKAFTERGLYMLATILKSPRATAATIAIIETFARVRCLKRELLELHEEKDKEKQKSKMQHFGEVLSEIVMPDADTTETESTLDLNFIIGKLSHKVKRVRK